MKEASPILPRYSAIITCYVISYVICYITYDVVCSVSCADGLQSGAKNDVDITLPRTKKSRPPKGGRGS